jgi:alpha-N-arabinofuranosidase
MGKRKLWLITPFLLTSILIPIGTTFPLGIAHAINPVQIVVDPYTDRSLVSKGAYGANERYSNDGNGMFDNSTMSVYSDFRNKVQNAKYGMLRYPAGTIANLFKWKDAIGPVANRKYEVLGSDFSSVFPYYGVDEALKFHEDVGAETIYMVGEAVETAASAADLVEYLNAPNNGSNPNGGTDWAAVRASNGHSAPYNVKYFEIGNEMYIETQNYWMNGVSISGANKSNAEKYALGDTVYQSNARKYGTWGENTSDGSASQQFYTRFAPVVSNTQTVKVGGVTWTESSNLATAGATNVYQFDDTTGQITFGDGTHGNKPANGAAITSDYQHRHEGFQAYFDAMKAVDPSIKIYSTFENIYDYVPQNKADGYVEHDYDTTGSTSTLQQLHDSFITEGDDHVSHLENYRSDIRDKSLRNDTTVPVTEYGNIAFTTPLGDDGARILSRGLTYATAVVGAINSDWQINIHQGMEAYSFGGGPALPGAGKIYNSLYAPAYPIMSTFIESSMAKAYNIIGNGVGTKVVSNWILNNPIEVQTATYPALVTLTTKDTSNNVYLVVVNRSASNDVNTTVNLKGYTISGNTVVRTLNGANYTSFNSPAHPNDVSITTATASLGVGSSTFDYNFPAHSVTSIKLSGSTTNNWVQRITNDFQGTVGTVPVGFSITPAGSGTNQADPANAANGVLQLVRNGTDVSATRNFGTQTGVVRVKAKIKAAQTNSRLRMLVLGGGTIAADANFDVSSKIMSNSKTRYIYSANTWYNLELLINQDTKTYSLFINGEKVVEKGYNNAGITSLSDVRFQVTTANGTFYVDDLVVDNLP